MDRIVFRASTVDLAAREVRRRDGAVEQLFPKEQELLAYLLPRAGATLSRDELLTRVWGYATSTSSRTVDTTIRRLREKIEQDPSRPDHLITTYGEGYRLVLGAETRSSLPPLHDRWIGRLEELAALGALVTDPGVVTLVGPPGVGKTRLALELATQRAESFAGRAVFADLSHARSLPQVAAAIAGPLGIAANDATPELDRLGTALDARGPTLLVLDNCETAVPTLRRVVERWLRAAPELRVLATSREPLGAERERVLPLHPLAHADAIELFTTLALDRHPGFAVERWAGVVSELVERLERLPLAIALAASRCSTLSPRHLLDRVTDRFRLLASADRDTPARHRTLEATLDVSWELLDPLEQQVMARISVFEDGFETDAAGSVTEVAEVGATLELLASRSLVNRVGGRWSTFAFVAAYAGRVLAADLGAHALAAARHAAWFGALGRRASAEVLSPELANLVAAIGVAADGGDAGSAAGAYLGLTQLVQAQGPISLALDLVDRVLALDLAPADRAAVQVRVVTVRRAVGGATHEACAEAAQAAERDGDVALRVDAHTIAALVATDLQRPREAAEHLTVGEALAARSGDPTSICRILSARAHVERWAGRYGPARRAATWQRELALEHHLWKPELVARITLARLDLAEGDPNAARAGILEALAVASTQRDLGLGWTAHWVAAQAELERGDPEAARAHVATTAALARRMGHDAANVSVESLLAHTWRAEGAWTQALAHHQRALEWAEALGFEGVALATEHHNIGEMKVRLGQLAAAEELLRLGLAGLHAHAARWRPSAALAEVHLRTGRADLAEPVMESLAGHPDPAAAWWLAGLQALAAVARGADPTPALERLEAIPSPPRSEARAFAREWRALCTSPGSRWRIA
ncbi:MAG: winged helix-turn-helix domain-containing protein [Myxococcota bacterium]